MRNIFYFSLFSSFFYHSFSIFWRFFIRKYFEIGEIMLEDLSFSLFFFLHTLYISILPNSTDIFFGKIVGAFKLLMVIKMNERSIYMILKHLLELVELHKKHDCRQINLTFLYVFLFLKPYHVILSIRKVKLITSRNINIFPKHGCLNICIRCSLHII